jgi:hypothetical protein
VTSVRASAAPRLQRRDELLARQRCRRRKTRPSASIASCDRRCASLGVRRGLGQVELQAVVISGAVIAKITRSTA